MPAEWVTVRRIRVKDSVEYVWWFSKTPWPKANNLRVLKEYSPDMMRLNRNGVKPAVRPSGHVIRSSFDKIEAGGAIPPNVTEAALSDNVEASRAESLLKFGNNASNDEYTKRCKELGLKVHPARFPAALPEFFIRLLTEEGDLVVDPFAGSNTTGVVADGLRRRWVAIERVREYLEASKVRFQASEPASAGAPEEQFAFDLLPERSEEIDPPPLAPMQSQPPDATPPGQATGS
jgi:site-specific DNA-methyltransferase (cytosine-N4-specific)